MTLNKEESENSEHKHNIRKTHITFVEVDDYLLSDIAKHGSVVSQGNSKNQRLEYDFEYCIECGLRLLDGEPIITKGLLDTDFERLVNHAKLENPNYTRRHEAILQHTDFEALKRNIQKALEFGKKYSSNQ